MSETISNDIFHLLDKEYISLYELKPLFSSFDTQEYPTEFSLQPYLRSVKNKMTAACGETKHAIYDLLKDYSQVVDESENMEHLRCQESFHTFIRLFVPSMYLDDRLNFITPPFKKDFVSSTKTFESFWESREWELKVVPETMLNSANRSWRELCYFVLNKLYDQNLPEESTDVFVLRNIESGLEQYYKMDVEFDFIDIKVLGELPNLTQEKINHLLQNVEDRELWYSYFPKEMLSFSGFAIGSFVDITDLESISQLKQFLNSVDDSMAPESFLERIGTYIRSYTKLPTLKVGEIVVDKRNANNDKALSITGLSGQEFSKDIIGHRDFSGVYRELMDTSAIAYREDLTNLSDRGVLEKRLAEKGIKGVILYPILGEYGEVLTILEITSERTLAFNRVVLNRLNSIFAISEEAYKKFADQLKNKIGRVIKENFTSIHPSVEWKFEEAAAKLLNRNSREDSMKIDQIVFSGLHPLFGQTDIIGSSQLRTNAIKKDLQQNISTLIELISSWTKKKSLLLLEDNLYKLKDLSKKIDENFTSSDESQIVTFINDQVHPMLEKLAERFPTLARDSYHQYKQKLNSDLGVLYQERNKFEKSVMMLNSTISTFLDRENHKLQAVLPHYFEKYKTDGVEYSIYVGDSISKESSFSSFDLQEFKLWQLSNMVEIVHLVKKIQPDLLIPLHTAQLIFVYNNQISVRFRMDEKRFDVDGAYNVRYEILKKRIDKAVIKGTDERLTIENTIAIVYLTDSDKQEYLNYIDFLIEKGMVTDQVEDLELEKMQGAEGLKALRIHVK